MVLVLCEVICMKSQIDNSGLSRPYSLTIMITNKCNLHCRHCWPESGPSGGSSHVDSNQLLKMIGDFIKLGVENICLTGGEPLLHPHWFDIVTSVCAEPGIKEVCLQTNATLLTKAHVQKLTSFDNHKLTLQVSLEGAEIDTHDKVRGAGSFRSALGGLALLAEAGLAGKTKVSLTETMDNFLEIPALLKLVDSFGIGKFSSGTLVHGGRAARAKDDGLKPPLPWQYDEMLDLYHTDPAFKKLYDKIANIAPLEWYMGQSFPSDSGCGFLKNPYLKENGVLYPCVMFQIDKYAAHNVYSRPLTETLREMLPIWAALQQQSLKRVDVLKACTSCSRRSHCKGGCMGRAYMAHGELMAVEDRCRLRKTVYDWQCRKKKKSEIKVAK
jgi:radical SAM protein with 4Fe4S-binding SPASM domain